MTTDRRTLADLAQRWSDLVLADVAPASRPTRAVRENGSVLRAPATEDDVAATERLLGRTLPPSYREFLLLSDGAYADLLGVSIAYREPERASSQSDVVGVALLPVADLRWLEDVDPTMAMGCEETGEDVSDDVQPDPVVDGHEVWPWTPFASGLVIAVDHGPGTTCLVPVDGVDEWQVWFIAKESAEAFVSFRSFLEYQVAVREPITTRAETREVLERAAQGDLLAAIRLERVTAPDAVDLLVAHLEQLRHGGWPRAVQALGRIATDEAVDALARLRPRGAEEALLLAGTPRARDVLASWECCRELAALGDPRGVEVAVALAARRASRTPTERQQLRSALWVLASSGDVSHVDVLLPHLDGDPEIEFTAAGALLELGDPRGRQRMEQIAAADGSYGFSARARLGVLTPSDVNPPGVG